MVYGVPSEIHSRAGHPDPQLEGGAEGEAQTGRPMDQEYKEWTHNINIHNARTTAWAAGRGIDLIVRAGGESEYGPLVRL